jgi:hypothetical protein
LLAAGKCFLCKEAGHLGRNCPKQGNMSSNRPNRPPGISSHNVEVNFDAIDDSEDVSGLAEDD